MPALDDDPLLDALFDATTSERIEQHLFSEPISNLGLAAPIAVGPADTVRHAVQSMVDARIGAVPVVSEEGELVGIFTERDVLRRVTLQGVDLDGTPVSTVMTPDPISVAPGTDHAAALRVMLGHGFRHLCVVDAGTVVGIFSMRELVGFVQDLFPRELSADAAHLPTRSAPPEAGPQSQVARPPGA